MEKNNQQPENCCINTTAFALENVCKSNNYLENLQEVIESHPSEAAKHLGMSIIHLLRQDHTKVLGCLELLAQNHPDVPVIHRRIAEIYINRDDYVTAIKHLEKVLKLDDKDTTAIIWLSLSYFATGQEKKAKANLKLLKHYIFIMNAAGSNWDV